MHMDFEQMVRTDVILKETYMSLGWQQSLMYIRILPEEINIC
jgi:hypothetical protein